MSRNLSSKIIVGGSERRLRYSQRQIDGEPSSTGAILITDPLPVDKQPTGPLYYQGETNICPSCGNASFDVRRSTAECMHCGRPMALAHRSL